MGEKNLDDLIIPEPEGKGKKQKGLFVILGLVIILLIFGIILANIIFESGSSEANNTTVKQEQLKMAEDLKPKADEDTKEQVSAKKSSETSTPDLAPLDDLDKDVAIVKADDKEAKVKEDDTLLDKDAVKENKIDNKNIDLTTKPKHIVQTKSHPKPRPKPHPKPHPKPKHMVLGGSGNIYIQVGSFSKGPDEKFINKIRRAGFKYRIQQANGFRRVLVGPFRKSEANQALSIIKSKISPNAFIKR